MVDLSRDNAEELFRIEDNCEKFVLIDHHISTQNKLNVSERELKNVHINLDIAACEATWEILFPDEATPIAVTLLGRFDIWDHKNPRVRPFQMGMLAYDTSVNAEIWRAIFNTKDESVKRALVLDIIKLGMKVTEYQNYADQWAMNFTFVAEWEGLRFLCLNSVRTGSPQFDSKFNKDKHDAVLVFYRKPQGNWSIHMYTSKEDLDLSVIAVKYGGGGHKIACGFEIDELPF
jgi:oligoribonuclease NrnB/cAMP/cGMP phosphodiesterase (DHH superfamily)